MIGSLLAHCLEGGEWFNDRFGVKQSACTCRKFPLPRSYTRVPSFRFPGVVSCFLGNHACGSIPRVEATWKITSSVNYCNYILYHSLLTICSPILYTTSSRGERREGFYSNIRLYTLTNTWTQQDCNDSVAAIWKNISNVGHVHVP